MIMYSVFYVIAFSYFTNAQQLLWEKDTRCPLICTCGVQHLSESAIYRFIQADKKPVSNEVDSEEAINSDFYHENLEKILFEEKSIIRYATCILQTETNPMELLELLPKDIESLTVIQGYKSGNKSVKFSDLQDFKQLLSLELVGANFLNKKTDSHLICEIDQPFENMKYLNLERILIKNSKNQIQNFVKEVNDDVLIFEYAPRSDPDAHALTMVQKGTDEDIVPYEIFKKQESTNEVPLFVGFKNLLLLRISNCDLNGVHWEMFDGLKSLQSLILENNKLRFIPAFAFYGTPSLKALSLAHNSLLDLQITDLAGLLELEHLDLSYNNFSQLSELSLPPFPKLELANFANNPISVIFPNTFEVMNTTGSLVIGSNDMALSLITNSFIGMNSLKSLTINNLVTVSLKRDLLVGMPILKELIITGNISRIEYDAFLEIYRLEKLLLSNCQIVNISMDAFLGLDKLRILDLSKNKIETLLPGVFDQIVNIKELYLNGNRLKELPRDIFLFLHPKLLRLNDNPWHCTCDMSHWKPMIINKVRQKVTKPCDFSIDKGASCTINEPNKIMYKYTYNNRIAPKCATPTEYANWSVFHLMRRQLKCPDYKPKLRKNNALKRVSHSRLTDSNSKPIEKLQKNNKFRSNETKITVDDTLKLNNKKKLLHKYYKFNNTRLHDFSGENNEIQNDKNPSDGINLYNINSSNELNSGTVENKYNSLQVKDVFHPNGKKLRKVRKYRKRLNHKKFKTYVEY